ncbi:hypothetical protein AVEN_19272-2-1, partial [Araneus ventricosus]
VHGSTGESKIFIYLMMFEMDYAT